MYTSKYPQPSVTATIFAFYNNMVVVGTRALDAEVFPGKKCIPGGFLNARYVDPATQAVVHEGETVEQAAIREFEEECGIVINGDQLILAHEHSGPMTDPRGHVVNLCLIANLTLEQVERLVPGDDLMALDLVSISDVLKDRENNWNPEWAFNHLELANCLIFLWLHGGDYFQGKGMWAA